MVIETGRSLPRRTGATSAGRRSDLQDSNADVVDFSVAFTATLTNTNVPSTITLWEPNRLGKPILSSSVKKCRRYNNGETEVLSVATDPPYPSTLYEKTRFARKKSTDNWIDHNLRLTNITTLLYISCCLHFLLRDSLLSVVQRGHGTLSRIRNQSQSIVNLLCKIAIINTDWAPRFSLS